MRFRKIAIFGGARSGKSRFAQELAESSGKPKVFIATGEAGDVEMAERIALHRRERSADWLTVEAPLELPQAVFCQEEDAVVVVDCLTLWLSNVILAERDVEREVAALAQAVRDARCSLAVVSNETGLGIVPETALARNFRDWQGRLNSMVARECEAALFMVAGLPLMLKPSALPRIELG